VGACETNFSPFLLDAAESPAEKKRVTPLLAGKKKNATGVLRRWKKERINDEGALRGWRWEAPVSAIREKGESGVLEKKKVRRHEKKTIRYQKEKKRAPAKKRSN